MRIIRGVLVVAGSLLVVLGILGAFLPLLPTTPFLLLAAACYARSSSRFHNWLLGNRWFGRYVKSYYEGRGIPWSVKTLTVSWLWLAIAVSAIFAVDGLLIRVVLVLIAIGVTTHVVLIPTTRERERR